MITRRQAVSWLGSAAAAATLPSTSRAFAPGALRLGLNTWSLRALPHSEALPAIFRAMRAGGLRECQLLSSHAEPDRFDPGYGSPANTPEARAEQQRRAAARTQWRLSVPLSYFQALRMQFGAHGLTIRVYSSPIGSSAEEINRLFLMAKTLGASQLNGRVSEEQTDLVAAAAKQHGLLVGIQVTDPQLLARQLRASAQLRADPDIGDLTKAGIPALEFVRQNLGSITSLDLKDALPHGPSVPFGTGASHMAQVVQLLEQTPNPTVAYIDCDYPGTGTSTAEVAHCLHYVRQVATA